MTRFTGWSPVQALDAIDAPERPVNKSLRLSIQGVHQITGVNSLDGPGRRRSAEIEHGRAIQSIKCYGYRSLNRTASEMSPHRRNCSRQNRSTQACLCGNIGSLSNLGSLRSVRSETVGSGWTYQRSDAGVE